MHCTVSFLISSPRKCIKQMRMYKWTDKKKFPSKYVGGTQVNVKYYNGFFTPLHS